MTVASARLLARSAVRRHPMMVTASALAAAGLLVRHAWLTTLPLSAGDWHWPAPGRILSWFPWPTVWDPTIGFGVGRFAQAYRYPMLAAAGLMARLGFDWSIAEKVIYFIPYAVVLPLAGWMLAREILGRSRWALLAPVILMANPQFLVEGDGHVPLALGAALACFTLLALIRAMRRDSLAAAAVSGLLMGLITAADIRITYLTAVLCLLYFVVLVIVDPDMRRTGRRVFLGSVSAATFLGTQAFWWLPLLTYHGNPGFPIPESPNFSIITLTHGLAGISAYWTGGEPARLVQAPLHPLFLLLPLLAVLPLLRRRLSPEVLWLAVAGLLFAFFAKTDNPPAGGVYDWMYVHVPGWKLYREGSKFLFVVAISSAVLVPLALQLGFAGARPWQRWWGKIQRIGLVAALLAILGLSGWSLLALERGQLGSTTVPTPEPASFRAVSATIDADPRPGALLWIGSPAMDQGDRYEHFVLSSPSHSLVNLTGVLANATPNRRDPFQNYCADTSLPYCYLQPDLFPYLTRISGARYLVAPIGSAMGVLPGGVTRTWLLAQLTAIYGPPRLFGQGREALALWQVDSLPPVSSSAAVALVDSGAWATPAVLPALSALDLPVAYTQTLSAADFPAAPANVPASIAVLPRVDGGCRSGQPRTVAVLAESASGSLPVTIAGQPFTLARLQSAGRLPGWGVYGPFPVLPGLTPLASGGATLGPCMEWSPLAAATLAGGGQASGPIRLSQAERVVASVGMRAPEWVVLRRSFDRAWHLKGAQLHVPGDTIFNLYYAGGPDGSLNAQPLVFTYSTANWERIGQLLALVSTAIAIGFAVLDHRRRRTTAWPSDLQAESAPARLAAAAGIAMLALAGGAATLGWMGIPSLMPQVRLADDPYSLEVGYGAGAVAILLGSVAIRLGHHRLSNRPHVRSAGVGPGVRTRVGAGVAAVMAGLLAGCGPAGSSAQDISALIADAQASGQLVPSGTAATLDEARQSRQARRPERCIADYTQVLTVYPDLASAYAGRGACYLTPEGGGEAAVHDAARAIALNPDDAGPYVLQARAARSIGDVQAAVAGYRRAITTPSATDWQFLEAMDGLVFLQRYADAEAAYRLALHRYPTSALVHLGGAELDIALDRDDAASAEYRAAEQLATSKEDLVQVLAHRVHFLVKRLRYREAIADADRAIALTDAGTGLYDDRATARLGMGDALGAIEDLTNAIGAFTGSTGPDAQPAGVHGFGLAGLYEARGRAEMESQRPDRAVSDFKGALKALPDTAPDFRALVKEDIRSAGG
jgi:tetratricopeptide (TPR) repeat protein